MPRSSPSPKAKREEAARLIMLRKAFGMSQRDFAKQFMVAQGAIGMWERGERTIPGPVLKLMDIYEKRLARKKRSE